MLRTFYYSGNCITKVNGVEELFCLEQDKILWVDLQFPSDEESESVQKTFGLNFPVLKTQTELESNARFYETADLILINSNFITR